MKELPDEQVVEQLVQVKGIGRWTAEMFLIFCPDRPGVLPVGDLGLRKAIQKHTRLLSCGRWQECVTLRSAGNPTVASLRVPVKVA